MWVAPMQLIREQMQRLPSMKKPTATVQSTTIHMQVHILSLKSTIFQDLQQSAAEQRNLQVTSMAMAIQSVLHIVPVIPTSAFLLTFMLVAVFMTLTSLQIFQKRHIKQVVLPAETKAQFTIVQYQELLQVQAIMQVA